MQQGGFSGSGRSGQGDARPLRDAAADLAYRVHGGGTGAEGAADVGALHHDCRCAAVFRGDSIARPGRHALIRPSVSRSTRVAAAATAGLWLATRTAVPRAAAAESSSSTRVSVTLSSSPVGSSASTSAGAQCDRQPGAGQLPAGELAGLGGGPV